MIIYGLTSSALPGVIRYVGKTAQPLAKRVLAHVSRALRQPKQTYKDHWIRSVLGDGHQVEGVALAFAVTDAEAYRLEHHYITELKALGFALTNGSDWGQGFKGYCHTAAAKARTGAAHRGRVRSPEELDKQRQAHVGKSLSVETRTTIAAANRRRVHTDESRQKKRAAMLGRQLSDAHRAKIGEANRRRGDQQKVLARAMATANRGRTRSMASRAKQSATWAKKRDQQATAAAALALVESPTAATKVM